MSSLKKLDKKYPGWQDTILQQEFGKWLHRQRAVIRKLAASMKEKDAIELLDIYHGVYK